MADIHSEGLSMLSIENFDALIFDMDGTLVDSGKLHERAWIETLTKYGIHINRALMRSLSGVTTYQTLQILIEQFGFAGSATADEMTSNKESLVEANIAKYVRPTALKAVALEYHGRLPMSVGTGASIAEAEAMLGHCGLRHLFEHVVGAEDVRQPKPSPDTFLECARLMGARPFACVVFEDSPLGLQAANAAGMRCVDVLGTYGIQNDYFI